MDNWNQILNEIKWNDLKEAKPKEHSYNGYIFKTSRHNAIYHGGCNPMMGMCWGVIVSSDDKDYTDNELKKGEHHIGAITTHWCLKETMTKI